MKLSFGSKELCRCLEKLGFQCQAQKDTSHVKYKSPHNIKILPGEKSFIPVQLGRKHYDKHSSTRYLRQIKQFGFTDEEIKKSFGKK